MRISILEKVGTKTMNGSNKFQKENPKVAEWRHPGGKLRERGPEKLSEAELLSILISTGVKGKSAEKIAEEIFEKFGSFKGMANQPLKKFLEIKGLGDVKIIRIAAAFEIARRIVNQVLKNHEK
jgi:DNA repair protein RadC